MSAGVVRLHNFNGFLVFAQPPKAGNPVSPVSETTTAAVEELQLHSCQLLTAWLERLTERLIRSTEHRLKGGFMAVWLLMRLEAGELLAGARESRLALDASLAEGRVWGSRAARSAIRRLHRAWRSVETRAARPGWLARRSWRVLDGLSADLELMRSLAAESDVNQLEPWLMPTVEILISDRLMLLRQLEDQLREKLKVATAIHRTLDALANAMTSSSIFNRQQQRCQQLNIEADWLSGRLCELWLRLLEVKYSAEAALTSCPGEASAGDSLAQKLPVNSKSAKEPIPLNGRSVSVMTEAPNIDSLSKCFEPAAAVTSRFKSNTSSNNSNNSSCSSTTDSAACCRMSAAFQSDHNSLWPELSSAGTCVDFSNSSGSGSSSKYSWRSRRLAERADRHFLRRQRRGFESRLTEDESGLEASDSLSSSSGGSSGSSSSSGINQPDFTDSYRWLDFEQLWDYSCQPGLYSETDDAVDENPIEEDWEGDGLCAAQQRSMQLISRRLEAAMALPSSSARKGRRHRDPQQQQQPLLRLPQQQQQQQQAWRRHSPESAELAARLTEGRRRLRRLRLDEEAAAPTPSGLFAVANVKDADSSAADVDGMSSHLGLLNGRTRRRLPADLLRRWDRLAGSLLIAEVGARLRQIKDAADTVDDSAMDETVAYSAAEEAADDLRRLGEVEAPLRRWLACLDGLRLRLAEAAELPSPTSPDSRGQRRQRRRIRERLESLDLMRRWLLSDWRRCSERRRSAQLSLDRLTDLEALIGRCELDAARALRRVRCAQAPAYELEEVDEKAADALAAGSARCRSQLLANECRLTDAGRVAMETRVEAVAAAAGQLRENCKRRLLLHYSEAKPNNSVAMATRSRWHRQAAVVAALILAALIVSLLLPRAGGDGRCGGGRFGLERFGLMQQLEQLGFGQWSWPNGAPV